MVREDFAAEFDVELRQAIVWSAARDWEPGFVDGGRRTLADREYEVGVERVAD